MDTRLDTSRSVPAISGLGVSGMASMRNVTPAGSVKPPHSPFLSGIQRGGSPSAGAGLNASLTSLQFNAQPPPPATARAWRGVVSSKQRAQEEAAIKAKTPRPVEYRSVPGKYPTQMINTESYRKKQEKHERPSLLASAPPNPYDYFFPAIKKSIMPAVEGGPVAGFDPQPPTPRQPKYTPDASEPPVPTNLARVAHEMGKRANEEGFLDFDQWKAALEVLCDPCNLDKLATDSWRLFDGDRTNVIGVTAVLAMLDTLFTGPHARALLKQVFKSFSDPQHVEVILKSDLDEARLARTEVQGNTRAMVTCLLRCIAAHPRYECDKRQFLSFDEFEKMFLCQANLKEIEAWQAQQGTGKKKKSNPKKGKVAVLPEPPSVEVVERVGAELVASFLPKTFAAMQRLFEGGSLV